MCLSFFNNVMVWFLCVDLVRWVGGWSRKKNASEYFKDEKGASFLRKFSEIILLKHVCRYRIVGLTYITILPTAGGRRDWSVNEKFWSGEFKKIEQSFQGSQIQDISVCIYCCLIDLKMADIFKKIWHY